MRHPSLFTLITLSLVLSACGFQPRGATPNLQQLPAPLYIAGTAAYSPLHRELSEQLRNAGIALTDDAQEAASILRISNHRSRSRVFSVDSGNRAAEYELEESLRFTLRNAQKGELVPEQSLQVLRLLYRPDSEVLAGEREEQILRADMRRELANRLLRRLQAQGS